MASDARNRLAAFAPEGWPAWFLRAGHLLHQHPLNTGPGIDPGHGGSDPGALGANGSTYPDEADFNLAVGLKVRTLLQNAGCTVVMTRSTDVAVDLYARRDLVNAGSPHASLCIHCNSASDPSAHVTETFWCLDYCNGDAAADQDLANKVQSRLVQFLGRTSRGVKRYNIVMVSPTPPSILGEMLFVSNQAEFDLINREGRDRGPAIDQRACGTSD